MGLWCAKSTTAPLFGEKSLELREKGSDENRGVQEGRTSNYSSGENLQPSASNSLPAVDVLLATEFEPPLPSDTPLILFAHGRNSGDDRIQHGEGEDRKAEIVNTAKYTRFVRISNHDETLIFTGGACLNNERANPTTGFGFAFLPRDIRVSPQVKYGTVAFRLENKSSYGSPAEQTSNRAELRAVIAALQFRAWHRVGWKRIVIATDSEYAINSATE